MKLTPWFDGKVKPVRAGVYQQMSGGELSKLGYQKWDGRDWFAWCYSVEDAANADWKVDRWYQNDQWRGILKDK